MVEILWCMEALYWSLVLVCAVLWWNVWRHRRWLRKHARSKEQNMSVLDGHIPTHVRAIVSNEMLDAAMKAYHPDSVGQPDRARLAHAIAAAIKVQKASAGLEEGWDPSRYAK